MYVPFDAATVDTGLEHGVEAEPGQASAPSTAGWNPFGAPKRRTEPVTVPLHVDEPPEPLDPEPPHAVEAVSARRFSRDLSPKPEATSGRTVTNKTKLAAAITATRHALLPGPHLHFSLSVNRSGSSGSWPEKPIRRDLSGRGKLSMGVASVPPPRPMASCFDPGPQGHRFNRCGPPCAAVPRETSRARRRTRAEPSNGNVRIRPSVCCSLDDLGGGAEHDGRSRPCEACGRVDRRSRAESGIVT